MWDDFLQKKANLLGQSLWQSGYDKKGHMAIYEQGQIFSWAVDMFGDGSNADHCSVPVLAGTWPALGNREISPLAPSPTPPPPLLCFNFCKKCKDDVYLFMKDHKRSTPEASLAPPWHFLRGLPHFHIVVVLGGSDGTLVEHNLKIIRCSWELVIVSFDLLTSSYSSS